MTIVKYTLWTKQLSTCRISTNVPWLQEHKYLPLKNNFVNNQSPVSWNNSKNNTVAKCQLPSNIYKVNKDGIKLINENSVTIVSCPHNKPW